MWTRFGFATVDITPTQVAPAPKVWIVGSTGWGESWVWTGMTFAGVDFVLFGPQRVYASVGKTTEFLAVVVTLGLGTVACPRLAGHLDRLSSIVFAGEDRSRWRAWFRHLTRITRCSSSCSIRSPSCCSSSVRWQCCIRKIPSPARNCSSRRRPRFSVAWAPPSKKDAFSAGQGASSRPNATDWSRMPRCSSLSSYSAGCSARQRKVL